MTEHNSSGQDQASFIPIIINSLFAFSVSLVVFLISISHSLNLSVQDLILKLIHSSYLPHYNKIRLGKIGNEDLLFILYVFLFFSIFLAVIVNLSNSLIRKNRDLRIPLSKTIFIVGISTLLGISALQQFKRIEVFHREKHMFGGKTLEEKNIRLHGFLYRFALASNKALSLQHRAEFMSGKNIDLSLYMYFHRILSYYLYPKVSLRFQNNNPKDCIVFFFKKHPEESLPKDYQILVQTEDSSLTLAIKKNAFR